MDEPNKITDLRPEFSGRRMQSEMGLIGDFSPNLEVIKNAVDVLANFDHTHETITDEDCFILMSDVFLGYKIDGSDRSMTTYTYTRGCHNDMTALLTKFMVRNRDLIPVFQDAMLDAMNIINKPPDHETSLPQEPPT